jgi:uncharacterized membrane protein
MDESSSNTTVQGLSPAELGALAHLYRGEVYRSTVWRTRLDATTNWAVVATGLALSLTFSTPEASPLPLVLVGLLIALFLSVEARRYRFFDFWRIRAHILELHYSDRSCVEKGCVWTTAGIRPFIKITSAPLFTFPS